MQTSLVLSLCLAALSMLSDIANGQGGSELVPSEDTKTVVAATQLFSLFGIALDIKQFDLLGNVFTDDIVLSGSAGNAADPITNLADAIEFYTTQFENASIVTQHKSDTVFVYDTSKTTARAISYANAVYFGEPKFERGGALFRNETANFYERFDDLLVKSPKSGWKISQRNLTIVVSIKLCVGIVN